MNLFATLHDAIRRFGSQTALSYGDRRLDFAALDRATATIGAYLAAQGCRRGDRVLLFSRNRLEHPLVLLAAIRAGLVAVPVNAKLHPSEVAWICGDAEPKLVIAGREQASALAALLPGGPTVLRIDEVPLDGPDRIGTVEVKPDDPAWLFYTSGTTGRPKGAVLTHRNLCAMAVNCLADMIDFRADDRVLHAAPLSHGSGMYLLPALARGAENIISDQERFDADEVLDLIAARSVTAIAFLAPTMIVRLLAARPREDVRSLRAVAYGGAPIHLDHLRAAVARFGPIFHQLYGQGEAPMTITGLPAPAHAGADDETLVSAGGARSGVEVRIVDDGDCAVPDGEAGEICVRGDVVMAGYWRNHAATAQAIRDGWLHTGDIGRFDAGGRLRLLDRRHDTIISGGTNIYPKEIEDVLASHPEVAEAVAFGVLDAEWGESIAVAVVPRTPGTLDGEAVRAFCRARIARFKQPRHVLVVAELPQNAYGKVLRRELRDRYFQSAGGTGSGRGAHSDH